MPKAHLTEKDVRRAIVDWLGRKGYGRNLREKGLDEHGIDIRVRHNRYPRYFIVETKGDANPKTVKHPGSRREVAFLQAVGQIVTRMTTRAKYKYAIGLPETYRSKVVARLPWQLCKATGLQVLLVSSSRKVTSLTWKELKKAQCP